MPITRTNWIDDDGSGTTGTVINNAEKTTLYNQIDAFVGAVWVNIPFNAANYTANSGPWTVTAVNQGTLVYTVIGQGTGGRLLSVLFNINGSSTLTNNATFLLISLGGLAGPSHTVENPITYYHYGTSIGTGQVEVQAGVPTLRFIKDVSGTPWVAGTGSLFLQGQICYPL
jgi:hypothetical protein